MQYDNEYEGGEPLGYTFKEFFLDVSDAFRATETKAQVAIGGLAAFFAVSYVAAIFT